MSKVLWVCGSTLTYLLLRVRTDLTQNRELIIKFCDQYQCRIILVLFVTSTFIRLNFLILYRNAFKIFIKHISFFSWTQLKPVLVLYFSVIFHLFWIWLFNVHVDEYLPIKWLWTLNVPRGLTILIFIVKVIKWVRSW